MEGSEFNALTYCPPASVVTSMEIENVDFMHADC